MHGAGAATTGGRIRLARVTQGLTQAQVADGLVSVAYLSRIEGGTRHPTPELLRAIASRLGTTAEALEPGSGGPNAPPEARETDVAEAAARWLRRPRDPMSYLRLVEAIGRWELAGGLEEHIGPGQSLSDSGKGSG